MDKKQLAIFLFLAILFFITINTSEPNEQQESADQNNVKQPKQAEQEEQNEYPIENEKEEITVDDDLKPTENVDLYTEALDKRKCKTRDRFFYEGCRCIDGKYDDGISHECQMCPYPCLTCNDGISFCQQCLARPFLSLDPFVQDGKLEKLEKTLVEEYHLYEPNHEKNILRYTGFRKDHGKNIFFSEKKNWPKEWNFKNKGYQSHGFKMHRSYRGSDFFHQKKEIYELTGLKEFLESLDIFEYIGNAMLIINDPNDPGSRHSDHSFKDVVSEHIWFRTNPDKQFYTEKIGDNRKKRYHMLSNVIFFDDMANHSISKTYEKCFSLRIDGKYKQWVRDYIAENFDFSSEQRRRSFLKQNTTFQNCPSNINGCNEFNAQKQLNQTISI